MDRELKKRTIETIKDKLLSTIKEYHTTRSISHVTIEDRKVMKQVWKAINPTSYFVDTCASCIKSNMDIIESWYGRESAREMQATTSEVKSVEQPTPEPIVESVEEQISIPEPITEKKAVNKNTKKKKVNAKKNRRNNKNLHNVVNNKPIK